MWPSNAACKQATMITRTEEEEEEEEVFKQEGEGKEEAWDLISAAPLPWWGVQQRLRVLLQPTLRFHLLLGG